ncbi:hypothetical protein ABZX74_25770 [Streptomyces olivaceoviridis]|uniref:hypothetical protein n=1 Tax=Streptomyces olivaceoviridis TaxID=1921 RepID=UPI0033BABC5D
MFRIRRHPAASGRRDGGRSRPPAEGVRPSAAAGPRVSDAAAAQRAGGVYRPLTPVTACLDRLDQAPDPVPAGERVPAALGPRLTGSLAQQAADVVAHADERGEEAARGGAGPVGPVVRYDGLVGRVTESGLADGGSDRLVDAIVARGDPEAVGDRVCAHRDAGASEQPRIVVGELRARARLVRWVGR